MEREVKEVYDRGRTGVAEKERRERRECVV